MASLGGSQGEAGSHEERCCRGGGAPNPLGEERSNHEAHDSHHVDHDVHRGPGGVLEGIAHGVADDATFVGLSALAAKVTVFHVFLGVVPGTTSVGHHEGEQDAAQKCPAERSRKSDRTIILEAKANEEKT